MQGRIWFPGNPWPDGHRLVECTWAGRLDAEGNLWFDLTLRSDDYDAEGDPGDDGADSDWAAPIAWTNYHACTISSMKWGDGEIGILAATPGQPFRFDDPGPQTLTADPLPVDDPDAAPAFLTYLLGHDSVADHQLEFRRQDNGLHRLMWTGAIALTYWGDDEFRYRFRAEASDVSFSGIEIPSSTGSDEARRQLARVVDIPERFTETTTNGARSLRLEGFSGRQPGSGR